MYRSRSTSSVYFDSILNNNSDGQSWNAVDQPTSQQHRYSQPNGTGLSLTLPRPRTDIPHPETRNNLTSALTGSRMATSDGIPSGPSRRPLPKALLPKSARATPTPSAMYGSSLGLNSPSLVRQDSSSGSLSPTVVKSPAVSTLEQRFSVQRMESTPVGGTILSPSVHTPTTDHHPESGRWSTLGRRPHTAGVNPPGSSPTQRPYGASVDVSGRDGWSSGRSHPLAASWNPPVNATPVRRREPVVQDSIVPFLKAALGKDNDPQNTRMQKEEESVNRQVFGRRNAGTGTLRTVSMYGSTDDIFGKSNSQLQLAPFAESTIPRVHLKSHSEVLAPRWNEEDLQRRAMRNSISSAVSSSDIRGMRTPGTPGTPGVHENAWNEPRSYNEGHPKHPSSTRQVLSYGTQPTPADHSSSWSNNSSRSTSNFVHSNGARPPPSRTPSWDDETPPPPPLSAPPISSSHPTHNNYHISTGRQLSTVDLDDQRNNWYDPIPVTPRNIIRSPSVVFMDSPRDLKDTKRSSRSMVFFGESFSPASFPLLAKVERDVLDGEGGGEVNPAVNRGHHSRTNGSKSTDNLATGFGWKEPASTSSSETKTSRNFNGFSRDISDISPAAPIVVSVQHRTCGVENLTMPSPPLEFRDEAPLPISSLPTTTTPATTTVPHLPVSHQATDSMNTEDSGLERWEKDGNDHSADEQDVMAVHRTSSTTSTTGRRSSSALTKKRSGSWHEEDTSEGRGSLSSSPRPHNSDEHRSNASPTDDPYLTIANNSGRFADENLVPSNSILRQLLAENARHTSRDLNESTHNNHSSERESRSLASHLDHSNIIDSEPSLPPPPLPPSCPPPSDFDSDANGSALGIDSESNHSYSTTVQSSATLSGGGTAGEPGERSRSTEDAQREHGRDMLRGWAAEDAVKDEGWLRERRAVASDANLDLSDASMRLTGSRETQISQQRIGFEATINYGSDRLSSETGRRGGSKVEEERVEDGERMAIDIVKGPVGVGFCIEGGKGSLSGDRPIAVKRVFKGGSIDGTANLLRPGDELLSIGGQSLVGLSHYEAWRFIKGLPNGTFPLAIRRRKLPTNQQPPQLL